MESKYYKEFTEEEIKVGFDSMHSEILEKDTWINKLLYLALNDFIEGNFSYDGATFVKERYSHTIFEVAAFVHDWLNSLGYVGYSIDVVMFEIMKQLNYEKSLIRVRKIWTILTFINVLRHKYYLKDYKGKLAIQLIL